MSALWGRIGAALVLIVGTFLQNRGVEVTQEQMDSATSLIDSLIANLHVLVAAAMVIVSKLREVKKNKIVAVAGQQGSIGVPIVMAIALACVVAVSIAASGCAPHQSATQQISTQTKDPGAIALATFADAQDAYIAAAELYQPYQAALRQSNPALDAELVGYLRAANQILDDWETYGDTTLDAKASFRQYLRQISIRTAQMVEQKGAK
jgi:hypothetical protein